MIQNNPALKFNTDCLICYYPIYPENTEESSEFEEARKTPLILTCGHSLHLECFQHAYNSNPQMVTTCWLDKKEINILEIPQLKLNTKHQKEKIERDYNSLPLIHKVMIAWQQGNLRSEEIFEHIGGGGGNAIGIIMANGLIIKGYMSFGYIADRTFSSLSGYAFNDVSATMGAAAFGGIIGKFTSSSAESISENLKSSFVFGALSGVLGGIYATRDFKKTLYFLSGITTSNLIPSKLGSLALSTGVMLYFGGFNNLTHSIVAGAVSGVISGISINGLERFQNVVKEGCGKIGAQAGRYVGKFRPLRWICGTVSVAKTVASQIFRK